MNNSKTRANVGSDDFHGKGTSHTADYNQNPRSIASHDPCGRYPQLPEVIHHCCQQYQEYMRKPDRYFSTEISQASRVAELAWCPSWAQLQIAHRP